MATSERAREIIQKITGRTCFCHKNIKQCYLCAGAELIQQAIDEGRAEERKACANIADAIGEFIPYESRYHWLGYPGDIRPSGYLTAKKISRKILARNEESEENE